MTTKEERAAYLRQADKTMLYNRGHAGVAELHQVVRRLVADLDARAEAVAGLVEAAKRIVCDWESVDEDSPVPDEINVNEHWDSLRDAIAAVERQGVK